MRQSSEASTSSDEEASIRRPLSNRRYTDEMAKSTKWTVVGSGSARDVHLVILLNQDKSGTIRLIKAALCHHFRSAESGRY